MSNKVQLTTAQKAMLQKAITQYNLSLKGDDKTAKKIDANDIFTFTPNGKGVVTVKVDAYGYKDGKLSSESDGQYDLELVLEDLAYDTDNDKPGNEENSAYKFSTLEDSSDKIAEQIKKAQVANTKMANKNIAFGDDDKGKFDNVNKANELYAKIMGSGTPAVKVTPTDSKTKCDVMVNIEDLKAGIKNLENLLEKIDSDDFEITENSDFLSQDQKDALEGAQKRTKAIKAIRKELKAQIKQTIEDLKDMQETYENEIDQAKKDKDAANNALKSLGVEDDKIRGRLIRTDDIKGALAADYKEDVRTNITGAPYAMPKPAVLDKHVNRELWVKPTLPQLNTSVSQDLTLVAVEKAITAHNVGLEDKSQVIDLNQVGKVKIDEKTGDILISMKGPADASGKAEPADKFYEYRITGGFYNSKSGTLNPDAKLTVEKTGNASTEGVKDQMSMLKTAFRTYSNAVTPNDKKSQKGVVTILIKSLYNAGVMHGELQTMLKSAGLEKDFDLSKICI